MPTHTQQLPSKNAPGPCGSGKKYKRCCGMQHSNQQSTSIAADKLQQVINLYQQGKLPAARHLAAKLLHSQPGDPSLLEISAVIALQLGETDRAITLFRQQLKLQPGNAIAHSNICMALHSQGKDEGAFLHGRQSAWTLRLGTPGTTWAISTSRETSWKKPCSTMRRPWRWTTGTHGCTSMQAA
jgi:Tfp pilus assembly protein PilF